MTIDEIVVELQDFIYYLAHKHTSEDTIMLDFDELVGELSLELVKGFNYYKAKDMTDGQMLAVIRRILDNRIGELIYKHFKTHRLAGNNYLPLSEFDEMSDSESALKFNVSQMYIQAHIDAAPTPEALVESSQRVDALYAELSPTAASVLDAILQGNDLLALNVQLSIDRAANIFKSATTNLQPWHVSDSLGMDESEVRAAFKEIRMKYAKVCAL